MPGKKKHKAGAKRSRSQSKKDKESDQPTEELKEHKKENAERPDDSIKSNTVTDIAKAKPVVDERVPERHSYEVYIDQEENTIYHTSLMLTDLKNNNNKYYIAQLLKSKAEADQYMVYYKWGRVGYTGGCSNSIFYDITSAKAEYHKKIESKIKTGYSEIKINFTEEENKTENKTESAIKSKKVEEPKIEKEPESKLDIRVQELIKLIFDMNMMQKEMEAQGYDTKKMPLGKLSKETVQEGFKWLKIISDVIDGKEKGDLYNLSSKFYTAIPHDFGFKKMRNFVITTNKVLKEKIEMVQTLGEIEIASKMLEEKKAASIDSIIDQHYERLHCQITPIEKKSEEFELLSEYVTNTHGETHSFKVDIDKAYKIDREGEDERFIKKIGNDMLLWHGSRLSNFVGILSQGLRIAPPEAPVTGYMFGKGVYFADMVTKSAQYCNASNSNDHVGLMLLCRVAIGNPRSLNKADSNANDLPEGSNSTLGLGKNSPPEISYKKFRGMSIPIGKAEKVDDVKRSLQYNEYIVYNVEQVKLEYLLKMKFK